MTSRTRQRIALLVSSAGVAVFLAHLMAELGGPPQRPAPARTDNAMAQPEYAAQPERPALARLDSAVVQLGVEASAPPTVPPPPPLEPRRVRLPAGTRSISVLVAPGISDEELEALYQRHGVDEVRGRGRLRGLVARDGTDTDALRRDLSSETIVTVLDTPPARGRAGFPVEPMRGPQ